MTPRPQADQQGSQERLDDARPEDVTTLANLWVAAWQATMPEIDFEARRGWFLDNFRTRTASGARTLALWDATSLLGFVMVDPQTGYLDQIAVAPSLPGRGAAARLLDAAKSMAPRGIDLDVNTENVRAVEFYRKHGFVVAGSGVNANSGRPTLRMQWRPG